MHVGMSDLVFSTGTHKVSKTQASELGLKPIAHGCHLRPGPLEGAKPWDVRRRVAEARIWTAQYRMSRRSPPIFTAESGLIVRGLPTWWNNPDLAVRREARSSKPVSVYPVHHRGVDVSSVSVVETRSLPAYAAVQPDEFHGLRVAPPGLTVLDLVRNHHMLQALFGTSSLLAGLAAFDRFKFDESQKRLRVVRGQLLEELASFGRARGLPRARALVAQVPAGFDSPAEAVGTWVLLTMLRSGTPVVCQLPVSAPGGIMFIDIALPDQMIAVEVSGASKFGDDYRFEQRAQKFLERQQRLQDEGWLSINVRAEQTKDLLGLAAFFARALSPHGVVLNAPRGILWQEQTSALFHRSRRF